ncbi:MAG TPA: MMPL family transporter [Thermoleophilaceae bacterium]|nr:MMPL family transporter [Thermoleophilaceae bacterium]
MLSGLSRYAIRRPIPVIAVWWTAVGILAFIGFGVGDRLHRTSLSIAGTGAYEADKLVDREFGPRNPVAIMVQGPPRQLEREGPRITRQIEAIPKVRAFGPWNGATGRDLHPRPDRALLLVNVNRPLEEASKDTVPEIRRVMRERTPAGLRTHMVGFIDAANAINTQTIDAIERAEIIAAPILMVVLLIVLGSPIAASIPLALGGGIVFAGTGILDLLNRVIAIDAVSLNLVSMMGLALGVDYALLTLARFRREQDAGHEPAEALQIALATAGRTVRYAGVVLALAMIAGLFLAPGALLLSASAGVIVAVLLSLLASFTILPAAVIFWNPWLDKWRLFPGAASSQRWGQRAFRLISRPGLAALLVGGLLLLLASPTLAIDTGPPDLRGLKPGSPETKDFKAVRRALGGGWTAPFQITVAANTGTITERKRLRVLARYERALRGERMVLASFGPSQIASRTRRLQGVPAQLNGANRQFKQGVKGLARLEEGLGEAGSGADQLVAGLHEAADGSREVAKGGAEGAEGAAQLRVGANRAVIGSKQLASGLTVAIQGTTILSRGANAATDGSLQLADGLDQAVVGLRSGLPRIRALADGLDLGGRQLERLRQPVQIATDQLDETIDALDAMTVGKADPEWQRAYRAANTALGAVTGRNPQTGQQVQPGYDGLDASLARASDQAHVAADATRSLKTQLHVLLGGLKQLRNGAVRLADGTDALAEGIDRLGTGQGQLRDGANALTGGLRELRDGSGDLADGLVRLAGGSEDLAAGLGQGAAQGGDLTAGLDQLESGSKRATRRTRRLGGRFERTRRLAPLFGSGYTVLGALDTATPTQRKAAGFVVNLDRGGSAAQLTVVKRGNPTRSHDPLRNRLERDADRIGKQTGTQVRVGGPAATLEDFDYKLRHAYIPYILTLSLVSYLVLIPILRSLVLPAIAVGLNLLTVGAAYGVLVLCFTGSAPLGGPGYIDDLMVAAVFNIVFALSIDYELFLLARVREGYDRLGTTDGAIAYALEHTAGVITGAAAIMCAVFFAFALSPVIAMRQLGLGLTVAVLLDATVVRLVLLPACLKLAGRWNWWLPRPLDRALPRIDWHAESEPAARA